MTGITGAGLGAVSSTDTEMLISKAYQQVTCMHYSTACSLPYQHWEPTRGSYLLPQRERTHMKDQQLIVDSLAIIQGNVYLALSYIQAQIWMQSTVAAIVREGKGGTSHTEIQKVICVTQINLKENFNPGGIYGVLLMILLKTMLQLLSERYAMLQYIPYTQLLC